MRIVIIVFQFSLVRIGILVFQFSHLGPGVEPETFRRKDRNRIGSSDPGMLIFLFFGASWTRLVKKITKIGLIWAANDFLG